MVNTDNLTSFEKTLQKRWYVRNLSIKQEEEKLNIERPTLCIIKNREELWDLLKISTNILRYNDIPWLSLDDPDLLLSELFITKDYKGIYDKKSIRKAMLKWHPDSFIRQFGKRIHKDDFTLIINRITETFQAIMSAISR